MTESEFNENDYAPPNTINNNDIIGLPLNESFINFENNENNENNNDNDDETTDHSNIRLDRIQNIITLIPNKKISISKKCKYILSIVVILILTIIIIFGVLVAGEKIKKRKKKNNNPYLENLEGEEWDKDYNIQIGGYYYVYSNNSTENSGVSALFELSDLLSTLNLRHGYLIIGIEGIKSKIDIGLLNNGTGWRPLYDIIFNKNMTVFDEYNSEENKNIKLEIKVTNERMILVCFKFYDANKVFLRKLNFVIDATDNLPYEGNKVKVCFYRCMSLVPKNVIDDKNDGTYMSNIKISELKIIKNNKEKPWGISSKNIQYSFKVNPAYVKIDYKKSEETFSIIHKNTTKKN